VKVFVAVTVLFTNCILHFQATTILQYCDIFNSVHMLRCNSLYLHLHALMCFIICVLSSVLMRFIIVEPSLVYRPNATVIKEWVLLCDFSDCIRYRITWVCLMWLYANGLLPLLEDVVDCCCRRVGNVFWRWLHAKQRDFFAFRRGK